MQKATSKKQKENSNQTTSTSTSTVKNTKPEFKPSVEMTVVDLPIDSLQPDPTNPNMMTADQFKGLKKSLKHKNVQPIIVDQDLNILDGHHRWQGLKELGKLVAPCIIQEVKDETERKFWRQVYNKLHGEHDKTKDKADILAIFQSNRLGDLAEMLGSSKDPFLSMIGKLKDESPINKDADPTQGYMQSFLHGNVKQIVIIMTNEEYTEIYPRMEAIKPHLKVTNNTDLLFKLIEYYENHSGNKATN